MEINPNLLKKYAAGSCSREEQQLVERWLDQQEAGVSYDFMAETDPEQEKAKLLSAVDAHLNNKKPWISFKPGLIAATWFLIACLGYAAYQARYIPFLEKEQVVFESVHAPKGKKITTMLPDGSKVYLNSGSTLRYTKGFKGSERLLILEGEAFFDVAKQSRKPFIIETAHTKTEVLGTSFNLKSFEEEKKTYLTVEEGRVQFSSKEGSDGVILTANKQAIYQAGIQQLDTLTSVNQSGWKEGYLVFNSDRLEDIIPILQRWYNVDIGLADPKLKDYRMRGRYLHPTLQRILEDLAYTTDTHFTIKGKQITIYP